MPKFQVLMPGKRLGASKTYKNILKAKPPQNAGKMIRIIRTAMKHGLPLENRKKCEYIEGTKVFELKAKTEHGPELRVFGFRDGNRFVLTECNPKKRSDDPMPMAKKVQAFRDEYFAAKEDSDLTIYAGNPKDV